MVIAAIFIWDDVDDDRDDDDDDWITNYDCVNYGNHDGYGYVHGESNSSFDDYDNNEYGGDDGNGTNDSDVMATTIRK